ncbi:MAG: type III pantothenate kinase [Proteobacteria bacterium]|nr:type III pantothenate kinase [Pseudomonadota bacterium]
MKLLFDIGNTSINWAVEENNGFIKTGSFNHYDCETSDQLKNIITPEITSKPDAVLVSNVAGMDLIKLVQDWADKLWQLEPWQARVSHEFGDLKNSYKDVSQMGVDRWLAMVAVRDKYKTNICLVDCGTALTIDFIDHSGTHLGGYIVPGYKLMQKSLIENTTGINVNVENNISIKQADNTQAAINNGACLVLVAVINQAIKMYSDQLDCEPKCIITGGMAELIHPLTEFTFIYEPLLVLNGLSIAHRAYK